MTTLSGVKSGVRKVNLMTDSNVEKAREFVKNHYKKCTNCGETNFTIHSPVGLALIVPDDEYGYIPDDKTSIQAVPIICDNCGNIELFSASKVIDL
jgi:hypothetical protein